MTPAETAQDAPTDANVQAQNSQTIAPPDLPAAAAPNEALTIKKFLNDIDPEIVVDIVTHKRNSEEDNEHYMDDTFFERKPLSDHDFELDKTELTWKDSPGMALDLGAHAEIYRARLFFDHLTGSREEYAEKMKTYGIFSALSSREHATKLDDVKSSEIKTKRTVAQTLNLLRTDAEPEKAKMSVDLTGAGEWSADPKNKTILEAIVASTVPKPKKRAKKKKKSKPSTTLDDVITPEEVYLDYQIAVAEEKLREHLFVYGKAVTDGKNITPQLEESQKRFGISLAGMRF